MTTKISYVRAVILTVCLLMSFMIIPAQAQTVGIKISPVKIDEMVDPGQVLNESVTVTNESPVPKTLYAYLRDFKAGNENGTPEIILPGSEKGPYISSWVDISSEGTDFAPGEEKTINFKINVPSNIGPGGYYGAVAFGTEPPKLRLNSEDKGAAMSISQQAVALVLLQVKGDALEEANIREFRADKNFYSTPFSINFLTRIDNSGNVHIKPNGVINITNMFGKVVNSVTFNDRASNIIPKSIRRFENSWVGDKGFGLYKASLILSFGTSAKNGGQGLQTMTSDITFWIIPWKIIIPGLIGAIIIGIIIFLFLNFYKNKAVQKAMEQLGFSQTRYVKKYQGPSPALHLAIIISSLLFTVFLILVVIFFIFFA